MLTLNPMPSIQNISPWVLAYNSLWSTDFYWDLLRSAFWTLLWSHGQEPPSVVCKGMACGKDAFTLIHSYFHFLKFCSSCFILTNGIDLSHFDLSTVIFWQPPIQCNFLQRKPVSLSPSPLGRKI